MNLRTQVLAGLKWTLFGRLASQVATWAVTIYVIRLLSPEDYGLMALAAIFSGLFTLIAEIGLGSTLVQTPDLPPQRLRQVFGLVVLSNFGASIVMAVAVAPLVATIFGESRLELVIQVIALQFIPAAFAVVPGAILEREMKFRGRTIVDFVATIGGAFVTLAMAYMGFGVFSLAWGSVSQATIRSIGLNIAGDFPGVPIFNFTGCGNMFNFGKNVAATQFIWYLYSQADTFIAGKFLGKFNLGIYSVSMDLASLPASRLSSILNQVVFPALSKVQRDGGKVGPYVLKGMRSLSFVSFPVMWGMSCVSPEIVGVLLGTKWLDAAIPLALLCLIMPLRVLSPILHAGLHAVGRADVSLRITAITAAAMCTAFLIGTQFGLIGLSLAWVFVFPAVFSFNIIKSRKYFELTIREIFSAPLRSAAAAGLMYSNVALMRPLLTSSPLINFITLIIIGAITYVTVTLLLNRTGLLEMRNLLSRRL